MREENVHACFEILSIMQDKGLKLQTFMGQSFFSWKTFFYLTLRSFK